VLSWQLFEENRKGRIKKGLLADFVILSADPTKVSSNELLDIKILETIKQNKSVYSRQQ